MQLSFFLASDSQEAQSKCPTLEEEETNGETTFNENNILSITFLICHIMLFHKRKEQQYNLRKGAGYTVYTCRKCISILAKDACA